jgi:hypothetical protein
MLPPVMILRNCILSFYSVVNVLLSPTNLLYQPIKTWTSIPIIINVLPITLTFLFLLPSSHCHGGHPESLGVIMLKTNKQKTRVEKASASVTATTTAASVICHPPPVFGPPPPPTPLPGVPANEHEFLRQLLVEFISERDTIQEQNL